MDHAGNEKTGAAVEPRIENFLTDLSVRRRLLLLGGLAIVKHGLSRYTKDADIWMEPAASAAEWARSLTEALALHPGVSANSLFPPRKIADHEVEKLIEAERVLRILGFEVPLDIFRNPNELEHLSFDEAWEASEPFSGGLRLMSASHLILTKSGTGRLQDELDIQFLENQLQKRLAPELKVCNPSRAKEILTEYMDQVLLEAALENPDATVREMGRVHLKQFMEEGDPFARDAWVRHFGA
ncbi:MAG: hypothetical protein WCS31_02715 [Verrucomicrobiae bacterium]